MEKVCRIKFIGQIWEIRTRYSLHTQKMPTPTLGPQPAWNTRGGKEFSGVGPNFLNYSNTFFKGGRKVF